MPLLFATTLIFGAIASGLLLGSIFILRAKFNLKFLDTYTFFILLVVCYGLINWIGPSLIVINYSADSHGRYGALVLFASFAVPLALAKLWLFIRLLWAMMEKIPGRMLSRSFFLAASSVLLIVGLSFLHDTGAEGTNASFVVLTLVGASVVIANIVAISYYLAESAEDDATPLFRCSRNFGWSYMIGYALYASPYYLSYVVDISWYPAVAPYIYYLMHVVPLGFVWRYSAQLDKEGFTRVGKPVIIETIAESYGISSREKDILHLVLSGLNNAEIAHRLSRSPNTVRNHIYNIYKKLDVKNRVQLIQVFDN